MNDAAPTAGAPRRPRFVGSWWFWLLFLVPLWAVPLVKSLQAEFPEPPPGFDREPEAFALVDEDGRLVASSELVGYLLLVAPLSLASERSAEEDFEHFRRLKKRVRGLGSSVVQVLLVDGDGEQLSALLDAKRGRKPSNLFLLDPGGSVHEGLRVSAGRPRAELFVLDRHGRLRGSYDRSIPDGDRLAQDLAVLANWLGSDPPLGEPVRR